MLSSKFWRVTALGLVAGLSVGCGGSDFDSGASGSNVLSAPGPAAAPAVASDAGLAGTAFPMNGIEFVQGTGPMAGASAGLNLRFSGSSNADQSDFPPGATVQAGYRPNPAQRTGFYGFAQAGATTSAFRALRIDLLDSAARLDSGATFSADSARTGARAQIVYIDKPNSSPSSSKVFRSNGGEVVITSLSANSVTLRLANVTLAPLPGNTAASGSPVLNGDATFTF